VLNTTVEKASVVKPVLVTVITLGSVVELGIAETVVSRVMVSKPVLVTVMTLASSVGLGVSEAERIVV